jgi:hypothetical protein
MVWEDMVRLPQKMPGISECASFLPQCKIKMEAVRNQTIAVMPGLAAFTKASARRSGRGLGEAFCVAGCRASTSLPVVIEDVDGRDKPGHDDVDP